MQRARPWVLGLLVFGAGGRYVLKAFFDKSVFPFVLLTILGILYLAYKKRHVFRQQQRATACVNALRDTTLPRIRTRRSKKVFTGLAEDLTEENGAEEVGQGDMAMPHQEDSVDEEYDIVDNASGDEKQEVVKKKHE
eukprot:GILK01010873.1.p1 GENE.GILK01010873.1~~GILK01010873.1.p1  ORF type:complete len:137 (-),score=21.21 GILK01010873.1:111-521(-)